jgi:hypothetical protein
MPRARRLVASPRRKARRPRHWRDFPISKIYLSSLCADFGFRHFTHFSIAGLRNLRARLSRFNGCPLPIAEHRDNLDICSAVKNAVFIDDPLADTGKSLVGISIPGVATGLQKSHVPMLIFRQDSDTESVEPKAEFKRQVGQLRDNRCPAIRRGIPRDEGR